MANEDDVISIADHLNAVRLQVAAYEKKYRRPSHSVTLLAVSKQQSVEHILQAVQAGQLMFGENYWQEARPKLAALQAYPIEWHFIGPLQANKTQKIAEHFAWVHSVDSEKLARRLSEQRPAHLPPLNVCLQVNLDGEASKSGVSIEEAPILAAKMACLPRLMFRGLMCIPRPGQHVTQQRQVFHRLSILYLALKTQFPSLDTLSMGMSQDYEAAIAEGATCIRIGK